MAISGLQTIDVGLQNESTGSDSLYTAFNKINQNFDTVANTANYSNFTGNTGIAVSNNASAGTVDIRNTGVISIIAGTNITVSGGGNGNVTISSAGGSGSGTVTSVGITPVSNSRITVSNTPVTTTGNISIDLANSGVTAGSYTLPEITVDSYGRVTNISNGSSLGSQLTNGNSNVVVGANSDITFGVNGNANILVLNDFGANLTGNLTAGNLSGTLLTGTLTTATQPNITSVGTLTYLIVTGNINSGNIITNNSTSGNIITGNITANGNVRTNVITTGSNTTAGVMTGNWTLSAGSKFSASYATNAGYADIAGYTNTSATATNATNATNANVARTVSNAAQPNITSVGTLGNLIVSGNLNAGNIIGNGSQLTGLGGPAFVATQTIYQNLLNSPSSISSLSLIYNNVSNNIGNGYNSSTGIFTSTKAGFYQVSGSIGINPYANTNAGGAGALVMYHNGNTYAAGPFIQAIQAINGNVSTTVVSQSSLSTVVYLNINDTVQLKLGYITNAASNVWTTETNLVPSSFQAVWIRS